MGPQRRQGRISALIPNPVAWLLFEKVWEVGGENPSHTPKLPHLNYATGFGIRGCLGFGSEGEHDELGDGFVADFEVRSPDTGP